MRQLVIEEMEFDVMPGCGIINVIFILKQLHQKYLAKKKICFVLGDLEKVFAWELSMSRLILITYHTQCPFWEINALFSIKASKNTCRLERSSFLYALNLEKCGGTICFGALLLNFLVLMPLFSGINFRCCMVGFEEAKHSTMAV